VAIEINVPAADVQRQIRILESNGLLDAPLTFGPTYAVRLTPKGELALEPASSAPGLTRKPIGF
jgi:hypothetical protein